MRRVYMNASQKNVHTNGLDDRLIRLQDTQRFLPRAECERIIARVKGFAHGGGETRVSISSYWNGELRWARNRVSLAGDRRDIWLQVVRSIRGSDGGVTTNQLDDVSLESAVRAAERLVLLGRPQLPDLELPGPSFDYPKTAIWSDATYDLTTETRGEVARALIDPAEAQGMLSAGYVEVRGQGIASAAAEGKTLYASCSQGQCSMTVRNPAGDGSGWAGLSSYDWATIDAPALAERALQKCLASQNPVALEPGRYTVVLEPQAVHDLVRIVVRALGRPGPEGAGRGPFAAGYDEALALWYTKLGVKVVDERVTISHDPTDPELGVLPFGLGGDHPRRVTWINRGVLTALADVRLYALSTRQDNLGLPNTGSYRMDGGETPIEEMIATTKRGLLVTRFSNIGVLDERSLLSTGLTRDGLWLIENGKISKAVKNFRFTESPLFVLNSLEQLGVPVPVFNPVPRPTDMGVVPVIVPPVKARDFSFTSAIDAI